MVFLLRSNEYYLINLVWLCYNIIIIYKAEYMYCSYLNRIFETDKQVIENKSWIKRAKRMASWATAKGFMDE